MLLRNDPEEISHHLRGLKEEIKRIEKHIGAIAFYMQGGLNYNQAYDLSMEQIENLIEIVQDHYEKINSSISGKNKII